MNICLILHRYGIPLDDPCVYPLGFMYVSAVLKRNGHNVKVLNYNLWDYDLEAELEGQDCALFTGFEEFKPYIIRDAAVCKRMGIHTVLGGALATFDPSQMMSHVDAVVIGEGEDIVETALENKGILRGSNPKLKGLPLPDYEGFGIDEYHRRHATRYMGVLTSRGCPFACSFCSQTCAFQDRDLRFVFEEIDYYKSAYQLEVVIFNDNTINVSKQRFMKICHEMKARSLGWGASIRADVFDEEMAIAAKQSGCMYFVVGVESFNQEKLDYMNKKIKVEDTRRTLDLLHKHDIDYHGNILVGFENESYEDIAREIQSIPAGYKVFPCFVYPFVGTKNGKKRNITEEQESFLSNEFRDYIQKMGKYLYPVTAVT